MSFFLNSQMEPHNASEECPMCLEDCLEKLSCCLCPVCKNLLHSKCMRNVTNRLCIYCRTPYHLAQQYTGIPKTPEDFEVLYHSILFNSTQYCSSKIKSTCIDVLVAMVIIYARKLQNMFRFRAVPELADRAGLIIETLSSKSRLIKYIFNKNF